MPEGTARLDHGRPSNVATARRVVDENRSLDPKNEIAIILDGRIVSSPIVFEPIPSGKLITGGFTETEANALASSLIGSG